MRHGEIKIAALCREVYRRICSSHGDVMFLQRLISRVSRVLHPALIRLYPDLDETRRKWRLSYILSGCMGLISGGSGRDAGIAGGSSQGADGSDGAECRSGSAGRLLSGTGSGQPQMTGGKKRTKSGVCLQRDTAFQETVSVVTPRWTA